MESVLIHAEQLKHWSQLIKKNCKKRWKRDKLEYILIFKENLISIIYSYVIN